MRLDSRPLIKPTTPRCESGTRTRAPVIRLAHHRSRSAEYYWAQSRAAISRDGRYVIFDSNMDLENTALNNYSDVYMIKVR
jgi:hypothetical protein